MAKTDYIGIRIEPELKRNVQRLLAQLGLTTAEAITLFFKQIEFRKELPFPVEQPNEETLATFEKTDRSEEIIPATDADDLFDKLGTNASKGSDGSERA